MSPTLVATKRFAVDEKSPDRIRVEFDAETYEVSLLVLEWDRPMRGDPRDQMDGLTGPSARITFTRRATGNLEATDFQPRW
jgi:hypothetical protein